MAQDMLAPWAEAVTEREGLMTAEDLACLPEDGYLYELVEGRLVRMPPPLTRHGAVAARVIIALGEFVYPRGLGTVFTSETGFLVSVPGERDTVLGADAAFVRADRLPPPESPEWEHYLRLAPDLVAEVASPSQYRPEMGAKAQRWLAAGTRLVWILWPRSSTIDIWHDGALVVTLTSDDVLDGGEVLHSFSSDVAGLFRY